MPQQSATPYGEKLAGMAKKAREAGDSSGSDLLCAMLACVQSGMYSTLRILFRRLGPLYCARLGEPPTCREDDIEEP